MKSGLDISPLTSTESSINPKTVQNRSPTTGLLQPGTVVRPPDTGLPSTGADNGSPVKGLPLQSTVAVTEGPQLITNSTTGTGVRCSLDITTESSTEARADSKEEDEPSSVDESKPSGTGGDTVQHPIVTNVTLTSKKDGKEAKDNKVESKIKEDKSLKKLDEKSGLTGSSAEP